MCVIDERNISREKEKIRRFETIEMRRKILERCEIKMNEERTSESNLKKTEVQHRILRCFDLVAAEAVYHKNCHKEFFKAKEQNTSNSTTADKKSETFGELCDTLEFLAEPITMYELRKQIVAKHGEENVYTSKRIKKKLREKYGDDIIMTDDTYSIIICLKNLTSSILNEKWYSNRKDNVTDERDRMILTAAKLIYQEMREMTCNTRYYPSEEQVRNIDKGAKILPRTLQIFLEKMIPDKIRQASIGQTIVYAVRPRLTIPTLLFGLGVELEHMCGSRWLVNELYRLEFCIPYQEVVRFKQSVLQNSNNTIVPLHGSPFTQ